MMHHGGFTRDQIQGLEHGITRGVIWLCEEGHAWPDTADAETDVVHVVHAESVKIARNQNIVTRQCLHCRHRFEVREARDKLAA